MKHFIMATLLILPMSVAKAQNLVENGSFEEYHDCPVMNGYWAQVVGWISPYTQSADYFNACAQNVVNGVPLNTCGFQYAANGQAYMGIITCIVEDGGYYREVIATELTEPLVPGVPVYCSFKVSPGGFGSNPNNSATWAAKGPGMNFFTQLPETSQPWLFSEWASYLYPNSAAIDMPGVLNDTSAWVTISGVFVPDSAYSWLAITNFYENSLSMPELLDDTAQSDWAYVFIDDVCVSYDPAYCDMVMDIRSQLRFNVRVLPNPFHDVLSIHCETASSYPDRATLRDLQGRVCWGKVWPMGQATWNIAIPDLPAAMYILVLEYANGTRTSLRAIRAPH